METMIRLRHLIQPRQDDVDLEAAKCVALRVAVRVQCLRSGVHVHCVVQVRQVTTTAGIQAFLVVLLRFEVRSFATKRRTQQTDAARNISEEAASIQSFAAEKETE